MYAGYQAEVVPNQNNEIEFQHFEDVQNEMVDLRRAVLTAGQADVSQFATVTLGTDYPARLITLNPPTPVGTLQTSDPYNITIQNESDKINVSTRFIEYQNRYNELEAGTIRYENSVLYINTRENSGNPVILEDQNLLNNGTLRLTALQNEFRESGTGRVTVELTPTRSITADEIPTGNLTVTIPTRLGEDYWDETLDSEDLYDGVNKSTDRFEDDNIYALNLSINTTKQSREFKLNTVGIQSAPEDSDVFKQGVGPDSNTNNNGGDDSSGGSELSNDEVAFDDVNGNGELDENEDAYTETDFIGENFNDDSVNLILSKDIEAGDNKIQIKTQSLTVRPGVLLSTTGNSNIDFETSDFLNVSGATISSGKAITATAAKDGRADIIATNTTFRFDGNAKVSMQEGGTLFINNNGGSRADGGTYIEDQDGNSETLKLQTGNQDGTPEKGDINS